MLIRTPNYGSLGRKMFGADWYAMDPPRHLNLLTSRAVRRIFELLDGFERIQVSGLSLGAENAVIRANAVRRHGYFLSPIGMSLPMRIQVIVMRCIEALPLPASPLGEELIVIATKRK